jgi:hypothetical protein
VSIICNYFRLWYIFMKSLMILTSGFFFLYKWAIIKSNIYESRHGKTNIVCDQQWSWPACASAQSDQDPYCLLSVSLLVVGFVGKQYGSWSDCANAQAGLDPCWSQTHYVGFVMARLILNYCSHILYVNASHVDLWPSVVLKKKILNLKHNTCV